MERAIIRPSDLFDNGLSTDRVEIFEPRLFRQGVTLGDHQNRLIFCFIAASTAAIDRARPTVKGIMIPGNSTVRLIGNTGNVTANIS